VKRDMDLIRELLLRLEALPIRRRGIVTIAPDEDEIAVEGYTGDQIDLSPSANSRGPPNR
jgi:hypothetical protein